MTEFFKKMNEDYKRKTFPDGSVFKKASKNLKLSLIIVTVFLVAPIFLGSTWGLISSIKRTIELVLAGEADLGFDIGVCIFLAVVALIFLLILRVCIKSYKKQDNYIAKSAESSKLPESDIRTFEQQAFAPDCYILKLAGGLDRVLSNNIIKDGLLTRDYIYIPNPAQAIFRISDLKACSFELNSYYVNNKKIKVLLLRLIASNGVMATTDTTEEAGRALMQMLKERNDAIDTNNGNVLAEGKEVDNYCKRILASN